MATRSFWRRACGPSWRRRPWSGERGAYRLAQALDTVQVPATVQAILASRIDRLPAAEKQLLQSAAVIGKDVPFPAPRRRR